MPGSMPRSGSPAPPDPPRDNASPSRPRHRQHDYGIPVQGDPCRNGGAGGNSFASLTPTGAYVAKMDGPGVTISASSCQDQRPARPENQLPRSAHADTGVK